MRARKPNIPLIATLFLLSGATGLLYEVIWMRTLSLIIGVTVLATSVTLASFMAGLAIGSYLFGRLSDRSGNPLRMYGLLEGGIGLFAILSPAIFKAFSLFYASVYANIGEEGWRMAAFQFSVPFLLLLVPTSLMGGTLPALGRYLIRSRSEVGAKAGLLYSVNTFGGVLGCFSAGFILMGSIGVTNTIYLGGITNLLIALVALGLSTGVEGKPSPPKEETPQDRRVWSRRTRSLALFGYSVGGFASLATEVLWTRTLVVSIGQTTYAFTMMLMTFLLGIALGSLAISGKVGSLKRPLAFFGLMEVVLGAFVALSFTVNFKLLDLEGILRATSEPGSWWDFTGVRLLIAFSVMIIPTTIMGAAFPLASAIYAGEVSSVGGRIGKLYSLNTVGAIFGAFAAGFLIIPSIGISRGLTLIGMINGMLGAVLLAFSELRSRKLKLALSAVTLSSFILAFGLSERTPVVKASRLLKEKGNEYSIIYEREGVDASLAVLERKTDRVKELNIDGMTTAFTDYEDMQVHKMLAHLPMALHPNPRTVLVVGFGFGSTAWGTLQYGDVETDCVELVKDERETADFFLRQNHGVLDMPNFRIVFGDGRNYIITTDKTYDVISFNAIHPRISPNLYTEEFYRFCREKLSPDGMVCAWLPTNWLSEDEFRGLIATFQSVFPHTSFWYINPNHAILLATPGPLDIDYRSVSGKLKSEKVRDDLREVNLDNPLRFLSTFMIGEDRLREYCRGARINSDANPYVEFSRTLPNHPFTPTLESLLRLREKVLPYIRNLTMPEKIARKEFDQVFEGQTYVIRGQILAWTGNPMEARENYLAALEVDPPNPHAKRLLRIAETQIKGFKEMVSLRPKDARLREKVAYIYIKEGKYLEAMGQLEEAIRIDPDGSADAHNNLGTIYSMMGRNDEAMSEFLKAVEIDPRSVLAHMNLGALYLSKGMHEKAEEEFLKVVEIDPKFPRSYNELGVIYSDRGDVERAEKFYRKAMEADPSYPDPYNNLAWLFVKNRLNLDEAIKLAKKALELQSDPTFYDTLGWAYYLKGMYREAHSSLARAMEMDPYNALYQEHMYKIKQALVNEREGHKER